MSNLSNPLESLIAEAAKLPDSGTLDKVNKRLWVKSDKSVILLDVSLSMSERVKSGERKIDILRNVLRRSKTVNEVAIAFNSNANILRDFGSIPQPDGSTDLARAIALAATIKPRTTLIISDGVPDSQKKALSAANNLSGVINCLFIGNEDDTEELAFMRKLAFLGCGQASQVDISRLDGIPKLASAIAQLAPSPKV